MIQDSCLTYSKEELIRDHAFFVHTSATEGNNLSGGLIGVSLQSRVTELEGEIARLREQLGKAKGVNDAMWESVVQKILAEGGEQNKRIEASRNESMQVDEVEGQESKKRQKQGRT